MDAVMSEKCILLLAALIDPDSPAGLAAKNAARAAVSLLGNRSGATLVQLEHEINALAFKYPREN